ncbi:diguanylate cyclase (GGDEF) domain protein [compost metagenome]
MARFRIEFEHPDTERDFQRHHLLRTQTSLRLTLCWCVFFYLAFALTDVAALGFSRETFLLFVSRTTFALAVMLGLHYVRTQPESIAVPVLAASVIELVGMATYLVIVWLRPDEIQGQAMSLCIMLIIVYVFIPNRLIISKGIAVIATTAFIVIAVARLPSTEALKISMRLVLANGVGLVAARRYQRLWREEYRVLMDYKHLSIRDHLTGCYNRRHLHDTVLPSEIAKARRHKQQLALIVCDIDHFKSTNDTYGHQAGDAVLRHVSSMLRTLTRHHLDSVVRYGGEEFVLVLSQTGRDGAVSLAERLRMAIAANPTIDAMGRRIGVTASFGVLAINFATAGKTVTEDRLFAAADRLLYEAKESGRNTIRVDEWSDDSSVRTMDSPQSRTYDTSDVC